MTIRRGLAGSYLWSSGSRYVSDLPATSLVHLSPTATGLLPTVYCSAFVGARQSTPCLTYSRTNFYDRERKTLVSRSGDGKGEVKSDRRQDA